MLILHCLDPVSGFMLRLWCSSAWGASRTSPLRSIVAFLFRHTGSSCCRTLKPQNHHLSALQTECPSPYAEFDPAYHKRLLMLDSARSLSQEAPAAPAGTPARHGGSAARAAADGGHGAGPRPRRHLPRRAAVGAGPQALHALAGRRDPDRADRGACGGDAAWDTVSCR